MKTKKDKNYSFKHVNDRLSERFNLSMTRVYFDDLSDKFKTDKSNLIDETEGQEIHLIKYKGREVYFLFNVKREIITTVLNIWRRFK